MLHFLVSCIQFKQLSCRRPKWINLVDLASCINGFSLFLFTLSISISLINSSNTFDNIQDKNTNKLNNRIICADQLMRIMWWLFIGLQFSPASSPALEGICGQFSRSYICSNVLCKIIQYFLLSCAILSHYLNQSII